MFADEMHELYRRWLDELWGGEPGAADALVSGDFTVTGQAMTCMGLVSWRRRSQRPAACSARSPSSCRLVRSSTAT